MLFSLFSNLVEIFSFLNVFKYLTVRTGLSMFTSMIIVFLIGNPFINFFSSKHIEQPAGISSLAQEAAQNGAQHNRLP